MTDLRVDEIDYGKKQVKMSFTAPGDNLDLGRVAKYDLKCSTDYEFLLSYDESSSGGSITSEKSKSIKSNNETVLDDEVEEDPRILKNLTVVSSTFEWSSSSERQAPNQAGFAESFTIDVSAHHDYSSSQSQIIENDGEKVVSEDEESVAAATTTEDGLSVADDLIEMIACKIRAIDASNNTSPWSSVLSIKLSREVKYAPGIKYYHGSNGDSSSGGLVVANVSLTRDSAFEQALKSVEAKESLYSKFFIAFLGKIYHR